MVIDFQKKIGTVVLILRIDGTMKQGNKIKLIDERTDNPDGMV